MNRPAEQPGGEPLNETELARQLQSLLDGGDAPADASSDETPAAEQTVADANAEPDAPTTSTDAADSPKSESAESTDPSEAVLEALEQTTDAVDALAQSLDDEPAAHASEGDQTIDQIISQTIDHQARQMTGQEEATDPTEATPDAIASMAEQTRDAIDDVAAMPPLDEHDEQLATNDESILGVNALATSPNAKSDAADADQAADETWEPMNTVPNEAVATDEMPATAQDATNDFDQYIDTDQSPAIDRPSALTGSEEVGRPTRVDSTDDVLSESPYGEDEITIEETTSIEDQIQALLDHAQGPPNKATAATPGDDATATENESDATAKPNDATNSDESFAAATADAIAAADAIIDSAPSTPSETPGDTFTAGEVEDASTNETDAPAEPTLGDQLDALLQQHPASPANETPAPEATATADQSETQAESPAEAPAAEVESSATEHAETTDTAAVETSADSSPDNSPDAEELASLDEQLAAQAEQEIADELAPQDVVTTGGSLQSEGDRALAAALGEAVDEDEDEDEKDIFAQALEQAKTVEPEEIESIEAETELVEGASDEARPKAARRSEPAHAASSDELDEEEITWPNGRARLLALAIHAPRDLFSVHGLKTLCTTLNHPLLRFDQPTRNLIGYIGLVTVLNALAVMLYGLLF